MRERIATWPHGWANRFSVLTETLSGTRTITAAEVDSYQVLFLDPDGSARNVDLPAEEGCEGVYLVIVNTAGGAENISVRNDAAGAVGTIGQNETGFLFCNGSAWYITVGVA